MKAQRQTPLRVAPGHDDALDPDLDVLVEPLHRLRADPRRFASVQSLAGAAGCGVAKLTALVREHHQTSPARLLLRARVDAACRLLAEGAVATSEVALVVGFATVAACEHEFARATGLSPAGYRALPELDEMALALPPDYCADALRRVQGRDATSPCERVDGAFIVKAFEARGAAALLHVHLEGAQARCRVESTGARDPQVVYAAHALAVRLLALNCDPAELLRRMRDPRERSLLARRPGLRVALMADEFEALTWAIIGQQVNLTFASTLRRRLIEHCGRPAPLGLQAHPTPAAVAALEPGVLRGMQFSGRKAEHLIGAARAVATGALPLFELAHWPVPRAREALLAIPGIGPWTTEYVLMRGLAHEDCVPVGDAGLGAALQRFYALAERPDAQRTRDLMARFAPHRSLATEHFWQSLVDAVDVDDAGGPSGPIRHRDGE